MNVRTYTYLQRPLNVYFGKDYKWKPLTRLLHPLVFLGVKRVFLFTVHTVKILNLLKILIFYLIFL